MKLHLAANYDLQLAEELSGSSVNRVYGKMQEDAVGGGRASYMGKAISFSELSRYIEKLKESDIKFTYLLNSSCLGNTEWSRAGQKRIRRLLDRLVEAGVKSVTVSTPFLLKIIKERHPDIHITVGVYAQVDTVKRVKFWESLGADAITLESFSINRDFERLRKIQQAAAAELILIANHVCLPNCPLQPYHQNCFAHSSNSSQNFFIDYCYLNCSQRRFSDPSQFIASQWIRPQDIHKYEEIGYHTFKLLERDLPSEVLLQRVKSYQSEKHSGNLAELFLSQSFGRGKTGINKWKYFFRPFSAPLRSLKKARDFMKNQGLLYPLDKLPVVIDNEKIPADFISRFQGMDCANTDCRECGYCGEVAEQAVTVSDSEAGYKYGEFIKQLENGEFWNV